MNKGVFLKTLLLIHLFPIQPIHFFCVIFSFLLKVKLSFAVEQFLLCQTLLTASWKSFIQRSQVLKIMDVTEVSMAGVWRCELNHMQGEPESDVDVYCRWWTLNNALHCNPGHTIYFVGSKGQKYNMELDIFDPWFESSWLFRDHCSPMINNWYFWMTLQAHWSAAWSSWASWRKGRRPSRSWTLPTTSPMLSSSRIIVLIHSKLWPFVCQIVDKIHYQYQY